MATKEFSTLISNRESPLIIGTINGVSHFEGKMSVVVVDQTDWVLRLTLHGDALASTMMNFQREFPVIEASVMVTNVKVDQRIEKSRLTLASATPRTTIHLRQADFDKLPMDFATATTYVRDYDAKKTVSDMRRYTFLSLGEGRPSDEPGGSVRFELDGNGPFIAYTSRTLTKGEIMSWRMTTVLVTHTRLSKRPNGGFHTTHSTCMMRLDSAPKSWITAFQNEEQKQVQSVGTELSELLSGGGWMSSETPRPSEFRSETSKTPPGTPLKPSKDAVPPVVHFPSAPPIVVNFGTVTNTTSFLASEETVTEEAIGSLFAKKDLSKDTTMELEPGDEHDPKHKAAGADGKIVVTEESVETLNSMKELWYRDGPRGRKWLPASRVISGGKVTVVLRLPDGTDKRVERRQVAYM